MSNAKRGTPVGGMAVYGGVMLRGEEGWAVAVRTPSGEIAMREGTLPGWARRCERIPVVRGVAALIESLSLGAPALTWSVAQRLPAPGRRVRPERAVPVWQTVATAVLLTILIFFLLPATVASWLSGAHGRAMLTAVEATLRMLLLFGYLAAIRRIPDVRELFANHGAEHMVVAAHDAGAPLTIDSVRTFSTRHARCGTTFLLIVGVVAIAVHALVGVRPLPELLATRVVLVPVIAGIAFELLRFATRPGAGVGTAWLVRGGLKLQSLTTAPPNDEQLEVALTALLAVTAPAPAVVAALRTEGAAAG
jgi:uncharacterized protein YqhQ